MKNENISYWTKSAVINEFEMLNQDLETDVLVVGGGIGGILAAYQISKTGRHVTLIEGRKLVKETTANTTAKITAQHHLLYQEIMEVQGEEKAKLFYESQMEGIEILRTMVAEHQIDCDMEELSSFQVSDGSNEESIKKEYEVYQQLGIDSLLHEKDMGLPFKTAIALEMPAQAQFHPVKFLSAVVDECVKAGVKIYEETPVKEVKDDSVETESGLNVTFNHLVVATHFPIAVMKNNYITQFQIERSYIVAAKGGESLPFGMFQSVDSPKRSLRHYHTEEGTGLLVGGENHITGTKDHTMEAYEHLSEYAKSIFKAEEITDRWSAQDMMTVDRMPLIGQFDKNNPNIYLITGFNKFGMATAATASVMVKDMILGNENNFTELFKPERINTLGNQLKATAKKAVDTIKGQSKSVKDYSTDTSTLKSGEGGIFNIDGELKAVYQDDKGTQHHVSPFCTHLGCLVNFNDAEKTWDCACHGSRFDRDGEVLEGPASKNLPK